MENNMMSKETKSTANNITNNTVTNSIRKNYLDNIRWITILIVVVFHIFFYYNNIGIEAMIPGVAAYDGTVTFGGLFQYIVYPWFMTLLFIVSGISARFALKKATNKQFMRARVDKVLVPSTLGVIAFGWIGGYIIYIYNASQTIPEGTPAFVGVIISLLSGIGALWFCHVLFVAVLVLMLVRLVIKKCKKSDDDVCQWFVRRSNSYIGFFIMLVIMFLILWGGSYILNMPVITSYRNGIYIPAFLMGYFIFSNDEIIEKLKKCVLPFLILSVASGVFFIYNCYGLAYSSIELLSRPDTNLYVFMMILFIFGAMARFLNISNGFTNYMKKRCFGIYVLHIPVLLVTNYLMINTGWNMTIKYIVELVAAITVSILLYEIISRIPVLRYWILGIRSKKVK